MRFEVVHVSWALTTCHPLSKQCCGLYLSLTQPLYEQDGYEWDSPNSWLVPFQHILKQCSCYCISGIRKNTLNMFVTAFYKCVGFYGGFLPSNGQPSLLVSCSPFFRVRWRTSPGETVGLARMQPRCGLTGIRFQIGEGWWQQNLIWLHWLVLCLIMFPRTLDDVYGKYCTEASRQHMCF